MFGQISITGSTFLDTIIGVGIVIFIFILCCIIHSKLMED